MTYLLVLALVLTEQGEVVQLFGHVWVVLAKHLQTEDNTAMTLYVGSVKHKTLPCHVDYMQEVDKDLLQFSCKQSLQNVEQRRLWER